MKKENINHPFWMTIKLNGKKVVFTTLGESTEVAVHIEDSRNVDTWRLPGVVVNPQIEENKIRFNLSADMRGHLTLKINELELIGRTGEKIPPRRWKKGE